MTFTYTPHDELTIIVTDSGNAYLHDPIKQRFIVIDDETLSNLDIHHFADARWLRNKLMSDYPASDPSVWIHGHPADHKSTEDPDNCYEVAFLHGRNNKWEVIDWGKLGKRGKEIVHLVACSERLGNP